MVVHCYIATVYHKRKAIMFLTVTVEQCGSERVWGLGLVCETCAIFELIVCTSARAESQFHLECTRSNMIYSYLEPICFPTCHNCKLTVVLIVHWNWKSSWNYCSRSVSTRSTYCLLCMEHCVDLLYTLYATTSLVLHNRMEMSVEWCVLRWEVDHVLCCSHWYLDGFFWPVLKYGPRSAIKCLRVHFSGPC